METYFSLFAGYAFAITLWWLLYYKKKEWVLPEKGVIYDRPWVEIGFFLLAIAVVIGIGQLYSQDLLFPRDVLYPPLVELANQALIFSPIFVYFYFRKASAKSFFIPRKGRLRRLSIGLGIGLGALFVFWLVDPIKLSFIQILGEIFNPDKIGLAGQVLLEDIAIAALLSRFCAAISNKWTIVLVASLFAAAHIPAFLASGVAPEALVTLVGDTLLGVMVFGTILKSRDILWVWPLHFIMDMTQFLS